MVEKMENERKEIEAKKKTKLLEEVCKEYTLNSKLDYNVLIILRRTSVYCTLGHSFKGTKSL